MDMQLSPDDLAFQDEVETFLDTHLDTELRLAGELSSGICGAHEPTMRWHTILHKKGWVSPRWPIEHGGTGSSAAAPVAKKVIKKVLDRDQFRQKYQWDLFREA